MPEAEAMNTVTFTEQDGRTTLAVLVTHRARRTATRTSTPAWKAACRSRSPNSSKSPPRCTSSAHVASTGWFATHTDSRKVD